MAPQRDQAHEAEDNSSQDYLWLVGSIDQELLEFSELLDITDATPELLFQTPHGNDNRDDFEDAPDLSPPGEPVGFSTQHATELVYVDPRLLHQQPSDQVPSPASDPGNPSIINTVADHTFAFTERQTTIEWAHWQQPREVGIPEPISEPTPQNEQNRRMRKCLKCRLEKKKCEHPTRYKAELLPAILTAYSMLFIAPDFLKMMIDALYALYANVIALKLSSRGHLRSDGNTVSLHMVMEDHPPSAGLRDEHDVVFYPERLRRMPQTDAFKHPSIIEPAIDVIGFDHFISKKMWPGHEQQPGSKFTHAQENTLQTARLFCGYVTLLANLDHIEIYTEYTEQHTARLICVALVNLFTHRLCQLYQQLGYNLQTLVDTEESNHYVAACTLELIYRCLRASIPIEWGTTNHPISQELECIRLLLSEWVSIIGNEIQEIERDFASPFRGDKRLKNDPTMKAAYDLQLPRHLQIHFETDRLSQFSTHMMLTRNGRLNMYSVPDLLSSKDIYGFPPYDQPSRDVYQPDLLSVNPSLLLDNGESSTGTSTTQTLQASRSPATHDPYLQSQTAQTYAGTHPSTTTDADSGNGLFPIGGHTWILGSAHRSSRLEGGASNEIL